MARNKSTQVNVDKSDLVKYPDARIRDNDGSGNGTPVNEALYGDQHEFFAKLLRLYGISYNGLPDNESNGYQLIEAIKALASKNDYILNITSSGGYLKVPLKLGYIKEGETFVCLAQVSRIAETQLQGSLDAIPVSKNIVFKGGDFNAGEYVRLITTSTGVDLIRLSDGDAIDAIAADFGYLKAATQIQEDAGAIDTVATTPLSNFTAFALRVIGADSVNFLATAAQNGLLSKEDKALLDSFTDKERNYGTIGPFDVDSGSVGDLYAVSGDIVSAQVVTRTDKGQVILISLDNPMDDSNYQVDISIESLGDIQKDNDLKEPVWKKISTTQFQIYIEEDYSGVQSIKPHLTVIQR